MRGSLQLVTARGVALDPHATVADAVRDGSLLLVAPAGATLNAAGDEISAAEDTWRCLACDSAGLAWENRCFNCGLSRSGRTIPPELDTGWAGTASPR